MRRNRDVNRTKTFMVYFMGILMIGSLFGIIFLGFRSGGVTNSLDYNGFDFINRGSVWTTNLDGRDAIFTYFPSDLELIIVDNSAIDRLRNKVQIDITSDFNDSYAEGIALAQYQMGVSLNNFNLFVRSGFTAENQPGTPIITCDDASPFVPVIYFKKSNKTEIYLENDCIIAEASAHADVIRLKDRLVYGMFGIIQ